MSESGNPHMQEFSVAYDCYADKIFRHCYFHVQDREQAKELMQETFMKTWLYVTEGKEIDNMQAFLYRVANNLVIDKWKKKKIHSLEQLQEATGLNPSADESDKIKAKIDVDLISRLFAQMNRLYKEVIIMRYIDDFSPKQIANILGITENVVSVRINRGIQQIRKLLKINQ